MSGAGEGYKGVENETCTSEGKLPCHFPFHLRFHLWKTMWTTVEKASDKNSEAWTNLRKREGSP